LEQLSEIKTIWQAELQRALRSGRIIILLALYALFSLIILVVVGTVANALVRQLGESGGDPRAAEMASAEGRNAVLSLLFSGGDLAILDALKKLPIVVLIPFKATLFFLPAYVALMGFDQVSADVVNRSIRYLTIRARRASILFGKVLSQATLLLGLVMAVDFGIFAYAKITNPDFPASTLGANLLKFWLAAIVFSSAYVALTSLCSTLVRSPAVSLVLNLLALMGFWFLDVIGATDPSREFLRYLSPSHYSNGLLHPNFASFAISVGAYAGFALVFLASAYLVLRARDL
jgi:ABC-2 type transport system permease protein